MRRRWRGNWCRVGDTELSGILVLSGGIINQLDPIMGDVCLEVGGRSPRVGTSVGNLLNDGAKRNDIGRRAAKKDEGDSSRGGRLQINQQMRKYPKLSES